VIKWENEGDVRASHGADSFSQEAASVRLSGSESGEIATELRQCRRLQCAEIDELATRYAIPRIALADFAVTHVVFLDDNWFEFEKYSRAPAECAMAYVIPCLDHLGDLKDIAALSLDFDKVALWTRRVSMLGAENFFAPRIARPLTVHSTPLEWLQANRDGVVIIDLPRARGLLQSAGPLAVANAEFGLKLRNELTVAPPEILVIAPEVEP